MPIKTPDYSNLNYAEMAGSIGLKEKHMPMLIGSFLEESSLILDRLENAINAKDYGSIKLEAHSIKGSAGNLLFTDIYDMSKDMELSAGESDASFDYLGHFSAIKDAVLTIKL